MTGTRRGRTALFATALLVALAGCGSDTQQTETGRQASAELKHIFAALTGRGKGTAKPVDAETIAREGLAANKGPMILASLENHGFTQILGMTGENGSMRTYFTPDNQAVILRGGMLAGTRGFGFDITSAETEALGALVRGRRAGTAQLVLRMLDGLGIERPLPLECTTRAGASTSYPFAGITWSGTQMVAHCEGQGYSLDNTFIVANSGQIVASRQWVGPTVGYMTIQLLRD